MATYPKFRESYWNDAKRVWWICGPERVLVEEIVARVREIVNPAEADYVTLLAGSVKDREIWAEANQYPLDPRTKRLVVVRSVQKIKSWKPFEDWLENSRFVPQIHLCLVSDDPDTDTKQPHVSRIVDRGRYVRCSPLGMDHAVDWVRSQCPMGRLVAESLLTRVGGDLAKAADVCRKVQLFGKDPSERLIAALTTVSASEDYVDALCLLRKQEAYRALEELAEADYSKTVGLLDSRLDVLAKLHLAVRQQLSLRDISTMRSVPVFLARQLIGSAKAYDSQRVRHCRQVLALCDAALRDGVRQGPMEALTALW